MKEKNLLLGITGGIATYKTCELIRSLVKENINIHVVMTENAAQFVTPLTFKTLSNNPVFINMFDENQQTSMPHIALSKTCHLMCIVPATANVISKIALGIADDLLTTLCLSFPHKIIIAPAMNVQMYQNPLFQKNLTVLQNFKDKYIILEPETGDLACGDTGTGRLTDINKINDIIINEFKSFKK